MHYYPLQLQSAYQHYLWGGGKIPKLFHRKIEGEVIAESWELSDRKEGKSQIVNGEYAGKTLDEMVQSFSEELIGRKVETFPILIKLIDANKNLSIQVHPDDQDAKKLQAEAKTEAWVVLDSDAGFVLAGFDQKIDRQMCEQAIEEKRLEHLLHRIHVKQGDAIYVPAGLIHAIGKGCVIFEVQQNSNTTYRVYDYGRKDAEGNERELHIDKAMQTIHFDAGPGALQKGKVLENNDKVHVEKLMDSSYFQIDRISIQDSARFFASERSFTYYFVIKGSGVCEIEGRQYNFDFGTSHLLPAAIKTWELRAKERPFELLSVTL